MDVVSDVAPIYFSKILLISIFFTTFAADIEEMCECYPLTS